MFFRAVSAGILSVCLTASALGQTTFATITGTVTDPNGAVVANAEVAAIHLESNYRYTAASNGAGVYTLAQLREGRYSVQAKAPGFKEFVAQDVQVVTRDVRRIDVRLELGELSTRVEVHAGATLIETESARISATKSASTMRDMPMNSRSITAYFQQTPGVMAAAGGNSYFRFAGSKGNQSDASIDGVTIGANDASYIGPQFTFIESYEELRVDMVNNTAEFSSIGQMAMISKSGTNDLHGSAFDYFASSGLQARNPFSLAGDSFVQHSPGFSIGGPVYLPKIYDGRNKSFFFFDFEALRGGAIRQLLNPTVPLAPWRQGDFSSLLPATVVRDPDTNLPFPDNIIPTERINPVSQKIQDRFWPLPNFGNTAVLQNQNYRELAVRPYDPNFFWAARGDHRFSDKSFVFGRITWTRGYSRAIDGNLPTLGQRWQQRDTRSFTVSHTQSLRPNVLNEFRYGLVWNNNPRQPPTIGNEIVRDLGLQGLAPNLPDIPGIPKVSFTGLGLSGLTVQTDFRNPGVLNWAHQWQDHVSWFSGRHSVKAGGQYTFGGLDDQLANPSLFGNLSFSNRFTNFPYADFLLGIPTTVSRANPPVTIATRRRAFGLFITDDFKMTQKLTLNIGLRYDQIPGWTEANGRMAIFDPATASIVIPDGASDMVSPLMPRGYIDVIEASQAGRPGKTLYHTDTNNFAPRIGLAWRPFGNNTVFRGGYGIFYDVVPPSLGSGTPFVVTEPAYTNPAGAPTVILPQAYPTSSQAPATVAIPNGVRSDLRVGLSMQYSATIEHQRWGMGFRTSYVGTNTRHGQYQYNVNQPLPSSVAFINKPRAFPRYPNINFLDNGAGHQYHALTAEARRPLARGVTFNVGYTLARDIGDLDWRQAPENAYDRLRERSPAIDVPTHRVTSNVLYQLPIGKGKRLLSGSNRVLDAIVGGWQISAVYDFTTGQFLTPLWTGPDPTGTAFTGSATPAVVTIRPNHLRDANLPGGGSVGRWFDTTAFGPPTPGSFGTSGPGVVIGPHVNVLHAGLIKYYTLRERLRMRWEMTATNALNHPQWSNPGMNISQAAQAGVISNVGGVYSNDQTGPRSVRLGLRLEW